MFYTDVLNSVTHTVCKAGIDGFSKSVLCCMDECVTSARSCTVLCQRYEMQGRIVKNWASVHSSLWTSGHNVLSESFSLFYKLPPPVFSVRSLNL